MVACLPAQRSAESQSDSGLHGAVPGRGVFRLESKLPRAKAWVQLTLWASGWRVTDPFFAWLRFRGLCHFKSTVRKKQRIRLSGCSALLGFDKIGRIRPSCRSVPPIPRKCKSMAWKSERKISNLRRLDRRYFDPIVRDWSCCHLCDLQGDSLTSPTPGQAGLR